MTKEQTTRITVLRSQGKGYKSIAEELGMPVNSVKSWCRRHPLEDSACRCLFCGNPIQQTPHKRRRKFCNDSCRNAWWNAHPEHRKTKTIYQHICSFCGQTFSSARAESKYCTMRCFADARRKENTHG